jgi:hypothetical protein
MIEIPSEADIQCAVERIFDLVIDLRGQDRWLTPSSAFHGTTEISSNPVALGTTYREPGPLGVRIGTVTEFERPTKVTFHQPMTVKAAPRDRRRGYALHAHSTRRGDPRAACRHA